MGDQNLQDDDLDNLDNFDGIDDESLDDEDRGDLIEGELDDDDDADGNGVKTDDEDANADADNDVDLEDLEDIAGIGKKQGGIPKARFDEVNNGYKAERELRLRLEEENARLRGASSTANIDDKQAEQKSVPVDLDDLEEQYADAIADGDTAAAKELRKQIRAEEQRQAREAARQEYEAAETERENKRIATAMQTAAVEVVKKYSFLDSASANYDEDSLELAMSIRNREIAKGTDPVRAIYIAAEKVAKLNGITLDDDSSKANEKQGDKSTPAQQRKVEAVKRNAAISSKQPSRLGGAGEAARAPKDNVPSEDDIGKMTPEQLARERGDFVDD